MFRRAGTPDAAEHAPHIYGSGSVAAAVRRKGVGTRLLQQIHGLMHTLDKSVLRMTAETDGAHAFMTRIGATAKLSTVEYRSLIEELDWSSLRTWEDAAADLGLVFECYAGHVPREVLLRLLPSINVLISDFPMEALEWGPVRFDIESFDQQYEEMDRTGGAHHLILLRAPDGAVAGVSDAEWDGWQPKIANQLLTAVAPSWRGRGVARALRAALMRQISSSHPSVEEIRTRNTETNPAILAVNRRFGFSVLGRKVEYQITRAELDSNVGEPQGVLLGANEA
jgi:GNAT superfamily N-acetyltransferase